MSDRHMHQCGDRAKTATTGARFQTFLNPFPQLRSPLYRKETDG